MAAKNYKRIISFDGTRYFGWEHQPNKETVQGKLESVLEHLAGEPVEVIGAVKFDPKIIEESICALFALAPAAHISRRAVKKFHSYLPKNICLYQVEIATGSALAMTNTFA